ncbi:conserved hypothetical protein [Leishmania major strain Friedlin]|uniref:Uncharacterized protein n=1 Tax=Leishmania major TaxID=5664 RepID=Q4QFA1_LEIMA|nr:conserved hypothetical protein [Leishmania major strain Friedlin]CAG9571456.1 hypothetical_protein_-_conserved [Leishmania major strain Friedlin]CAJ03308.1 conserved hypothetical protein [Leishmania major strain Friedlin]|eukprot:XP_001681997.1 conserved hypothetical protein [Leishmania major strain Friedlin]
MRRASPAASQVAAHPPPLHSSTLPRRARWRATSTPASGRWNCCYQPHCGSMRSCRSARVEPCCHGTSSRFRALRPVSFVSPPRRARSTLHRARQQRRLLPWKSHAAKAVLMLAAAYPAGGPSWQFTATSSEHVRRPPRARRWAEVPRRACLEESPVEDVFLSECLRCTFSLSIRYLPSPSMSLVDGCSVAEVDDGDDYGEEVDPQGNGLSSTCSCSSTTSRAESIGAAAWHPTTAAVASEVGTKYAMVRECQMTRSAFSVPAAGAALSAHRSGRRRGAAVSACPHCARRRCCLHLS